MTTSDIGGVDNTLLDTVARLVRLIERPGGLDAGDVLLLMSFLWRIPADANAEPQAHRMMDLALDGLARQQTRAMEIDEDRPTWRRPLAAGVEIGGRQDHPARRRRRRSATAVPGLPVDG